MNELQQQIEWLESEVQGALAVASTRQDHLRLTQIQYRLSYIAGLARS